MKRCFRKIVYNKEVHTCIFCLISNPLMYNFNLHVACPLMIQNRETPQNRVRDRIGIYLQISIYSKKTLQTWNITKVPKANLQAVKIQLAHFFAMFHVWQLRIKLFKLVNGVYYFSIVRDRRLFWNKYWFVNTFQFDP